MHFPGVICPLGSEIDSIGANSDGENLYQKLTVTHAKAKTTEPNKATKKKERKKGGFAGWEGTAKW